MNILLSIVDVLLINEFLSKACSSEKPISHIHIFIYLSDLINKLHLVKLLFSMVQRVVNLHPIRPVFIYV